MAAPVFSRKTGDRVGSVGVTLTEDGDAVDLSAAVAVTFLARPVRGSTTGTPAIREACVVVSAAAGSVRYDPSAAFAALPAGDYRVEVEVEWAGGKRQTFPNDRVDTFRLVQDLGTSAP